MRHKSLDPIPPGEILREEFMRPMGISINALARSIDVPPNRFIEAVKTQGVQIVCMSALLTTTMSGMKTTVDALKEAGIGGQVRTLIGGAPVTQTYADQIGADGYAPDAASAVEKAQELVTSLK